MARPKKKGLDYFPLDVYFMQDRKMKPVKRKYGAEGILVYIHILCRIYREEGYFAYADEDFFGDICDELNIDEDKLREITGFLLERSLFDKDLFESCGILTSAGVQARFRKATADRKKTPEIADRRFWLLTDEEGAENDKNYFPEKNPHFPEKKYTKESKGNKSKKEESKTEERESKEEFSTPSPPEFYEVVGYGADMRYTYIDHREFYSYYSKNGWPEDWRSALDMWAKRERQAQERVSGEKNTSDAGDFPPHIDEVRAYARQMRYAFTDIDKFYDYYSSKGFPRNWKRILASWAEKDEKEYVRRTQKEFEEDYEWHSFATTSPGKVR